MTANQSFSGDPVAPDSALIKVYVRELSQLFDSMDPSPFREKDLDRNAHEYIVETAKELSTRVPIALIVYLERSIGLPDEGKILGDAIREHFARKSRRLRFELRQLLRRGWISLIIGLSFLAATVIAGEAVIRRMPHSPWAAIFHESLLIGGWVAMWKPLELFLYDWWPILGERHVYDRLSRMPIQIVYAESSQESATARALTRPDFRTDTLRPGMKAGQHDLHAHSA